MVEISVAITPTSKEILVAYKSLLKTSLPIKSVPSQKSLEGAAANGPAISVGS